MGDITDQVGTIETTGVAPGPHSDVRGVSIAFDLADEKLAQETEDPNLSVKLGNKVSGSADQSLEERLSAKATAAGTEEAQNDPDAPPSLVSEEGHPPPVSPSPPYDQTPDTTGTDEVSASAMGHETTEAMHTDTIETSDTGGGPDLGDVSPGDGATASSSLSGADSATAVASDPKTDAEHPNEVTGDAARPLTDKYSSMTNAQLVKISKENGLEPKSGANKHELIDQLLKHGINPPSDSVVD